MERFPMVVLPVVVGVVLGIGIDGVLRCKRGRTGVRPVHRAFFLRLCCLATACLATLSTTRSAHGDVAVRVKGQMLTGIWVQVESVTAGVPMSFRTMNLSQGGDTVLHVQKYPDGSFVAGNDDYPGLGLASQVTFTPSFTGQVWVVVRAFGAAHGTGTLRRILGSSTKDTAITYSGSSLILGEAMTGGVAYTVEEQQGAGDTVLLALSSTSHAVAFDDDDGFGYMSFLSISSGDLCSPSCSLVAGTYRGSPTAAQSVTAIADERTSDEDGDTLGSALELQIGTAPTDIDSDDDGLPDAYEVYGYGEWHGVSPNVNLATYGASPTEKDIFFEGDYLSSAGKFAVPVIQEAAAIFEQAGIHAHFDVGQWTADPYWRTRYGDWGGATAVSDAADCTGLTPSRGRLFHHMLADGPPNSPQGGHHTYSPIPGSGSSALHSCYVGGQDLWLLMHETGHFVLEHSGVVPGNSGMDCNPFYASVMNQTGFMSGFSDGNGPWSGNPTSMLESGWESLSYVNTLGQPPWNLKVDAAAGLIDWNRNNLFDPFPVSAAITWAEQDCDVSGYAARRFAGTANEANSFVRNATLTWIRNGGPSRLFMIGRNGSTGVPRFGSIPAGELQDCDGQPARHSPCGTWSSFHDVEAATPAWYAPAAVDVGNGQILLAYIEAFSRVVQAQIGAVNFATGGVDWGPRVSLGTSEPYDGDLALILEGSTARLYAPITSGTRRLHEFSYDVGSHQWSAPSFQKYWSDNGWFPWGEWLEPSFGVGLTLGVDGSDGGETVFALMPGDLGKLQLLRRLPSGFWVKYDLFFPLGGPEGLDAPVTLATPGLAYRANRFYIAFQDEVGVARIGISEGDRGDVTAADRRMQIRPYPTFAFNRWGVVQENVSLVGHPDDSHLRLAATAPCYDGSCDDKLTVFAPLADGIVDATLTDHDDHSMLRQSLDCALWACCFTSGCPAWVQ